MFYSINLSRNFFFFSVRRERYDAIFDNEKLGIELMSFGAKQSVVRVTGTHPIGVPHIGDQVHLLVT